MLNRLAGLVQLSRDISLCLNRLAELGSRVISLPKFWITFVIDGCLSDSQR